MQLTKTIRVFICTLIAAMLVCALSGCVKETSTDDDILNDAGTGSGAAIIVDPDD